MLSHPHRHTRGALSCTQPPSQPQPKRDSALRKEMEPGFHSQIRQIWAELREMHLQLEAAQLLLYPESPKCRASFFPPLNIICRKQWELKGVVSFDCFFFFFSPLFNLFALQKPGVNRMLHCTSLPSGKETAQQVLQPKPCAIQPNAACLRAAHKHTRSHPAARSHQVPTCFGNAHQQDLVLFVSLFLFFFSSP